MQCFDTFTRILTIDKDFSRVPKVLVLPPPPSLSLSLSVLYESLIISTQISYFLHTNLSSFAISRIHHATI